MNYIQIEIGGKLRGLKFLQQALMIYQQLVDPDFPVATSSCAIIFGGLKCNATAKREELLNEDGTEVTFEQVCEWVEELTPETVTEVIKVWNECVYGWQDKGVLKKPKEEKKNITEETIQQTVTEQPVSWV